MGPLPRTSTTRSTTRWQSAPWRRQESPNVSQLVGVLSIGPDRTGRMLEVITVDDVDDGAVAIQAMKLRKAYERYLPREDTA